MKKVYEAPTAEKIAFRYRDQVVAASGTETPGGMETPGGTTNCSLDFVGEALIPEAWGGGCNIMEYNK